MVRHHVKKSKKRKKHQSQQQKHLTKQELLQKRIEEGLDEFAGSSEEEEEEEAVKGVNVDEENSEDDQSIPDINNESDDVKIKDDDDDDDDDDDSEDEIEDSDNDEGKDSVDKVGGSDEEDGRAPRATNKAEAMADIMSRILGTDATKAASTSLTSEKSTKSVVLSKTVTKLQRLRDSERERDLELKKRRRENRTNKLAAMYTPMITNANESISERAHRHIATKGVVALFNAIARHQHDQLTSVGLEGDRKADAPSSCKEDFLERLKVGVSDTKGSRQETSREMRTFAEKKNESTNNGGWAALKDDFMMGSNKLKGWDNGSDEDEDDSIEQDAAEMERLGDLSSDDEGEDKAIAKEIKRKRIDRSQSRKKSKRRQ